MPLPLPHLGEFILLSQTTTKQHLLAGEAMSPNPCLVPHACGNSGRLTTSVILQQGCFTLPRWIPQTFAWGSWKENMEIGVMPWKRACCSPAPLRVGSLQVAR